MPKLRPRGEAHWRRHGQIKADAAGAAVCLVTERVALVLQLLFNRSLAAGNIIKILG